MNISSSIPGVTSILPSVVTVRPEEAAQRRQLVQAAKSVNASGTLGENQLVFAVDRHTHRIDHAGGEPRHSRGGASGAS